MKQLLNRNIEHLNFSNDPEQCRKHINQFIANATHNQYEDILEMDDITHDTQMLFVNTVYFKGEWV